MTTLEINAEAFAAARREANRQQQLRIADLETQITALQGRMHALQQAAKRHAYYQGELIGGVNAALDTARLTCASPTVIRLLERILARRSVKAVEEADEAAGRIPISRRLHTVMGLIANGLSNEQIAHQLHIEPSTVKTHVTRLLTVLSASNRAHVVHLAHTAGWLDRPAAIQAKDSAA